MPQDQTPSNPKHSTDLQSLLTGAIPQRAAFTIIILSLVAVQSAAAQSNAVCSPDNLPSMIEGFFQLTTALGIVGLAIVWQSDSLIEMFTLNPEQKKGLKRHKRSAMKSAVVLVVLGSHIRWLYDGPSTETMRQLGPLVNPSQSPIEVLY